MSKIGTKWFLRIGAGADGAGPGAGSGAGCWLKPICGAASIMVELRTNGRQNMRLQVAKHMPEPRQLLQSDRGDRRLSRGVRLMTLRRRDLPCHGRRVI